MTGPRRLLETGSPAARSLLLAGKRDRPPAALGGTLLGALGVAMPSVGAKLVTAVRHAVLSKIGVGVVALAAATGGGYLAGRMDERAGARAQHQSALVVPSERPRHADPTVVTDRPSPAVSGVMPTTDTPAVQHVAKPTPTAVTMHVDPKAMTPAAGAASATPSLFGEIDEIRRVRSLVGAGQGKAALEALDAYDTSHPRGTFQEETLALRVRALRLNGDVVEAERTLHTLESRFPNSIQLAGLEP